MNADKFHEYFQLSGVPGSRMDPVQSNALVVRSPCSEFAVNQIVVAMEQSQNKWIATLNHAVIRYLWL